MRTIKFRALAEYNNGEKEWFYYTTETGKILIDMFVNCKIKRWIIKDLQFTGLLDKNKKEIYVGDIIKDVYQQSPEFSLDWIESEYITEVKIPDIYLDYAQSPALRDFKNMKKYFKTSSKKLGIEIIGNKYENKELRINI